jgi:hypothetical protein
MLGLSSISWGITSRAFHTSYQFGECGLYEGGLEESRDGKRRGGYRGVVWERSEV